MTTHHPGSRLGLRDAPPLLLTAALLALFVFPVTRDLYARWYAALPLVVTFVKFAVLATGGELVATRIRTGVYLTRGFGVVPRMIVWGVLGLAIYAAFAIFAAGVPALFESLITRAHGSRLLTAFLISLFMNVLFAPGMMLSHRITDAWIARNDGRFPLRGLRVRTLLEEVDWFRMWDVVLKRTIPFFWIPAHTVTFLLPEQFRTAFAALLSVALGLFLGAFGARLNRRPMADTPQEATP